MNRAALWGAAAGFAAWALTSKPAASLTLETFDNVKAFLRLSAMRGLDFPAILANRNMAALLRVIRTGEGTADADGYRRIFGGELFSGYADHPRRTVCKTYSGRRLCSTAAGAYQALASTWDETARIVGLADFSPASQDRFAVARIAARGALDDVLAGRLSVALPKIAYEWASMPGSPYGQPVITASRAGTVYQSNGGILAA